MTTTAKRAVFGALALPGIPPFIRSFHAKKAPILMYHSIVDGPPIAWTQVHVEEFRRQMQYLCRSYTILSLTDLVEQLTSNELPRNAAAVTFDDGFQNFKSLAMPILEEYGIPVTVYLTTSFIDGQNEFDGLIWPDYVHALLLSTTNDRLDLTEVSLGTIDIADTTARHRAKSMICEALKQLPSDVRRVRIGGLSEQLGGTIASKYRSLFAGMTWGEVEELSHNPLVDIGAHTLTHGILSRTPREEMRREILDSKRILAERLSHEIEHFAYPNGDPGDYDEAALEVVSATFRSAVTTVPRMASPASSRFELPRLGIGSDMFFSKFQLFVSGLMEMKR